MKNNSFKNYEILSQKQIYHQNFGIFKKLSNLKSQFSKIFKEKSSTHNQMFKGKLLNKDNKEREKDTKIIRRNKSLINPSILQASLSRENLKSPGKIILDRNKQISGVSNRSNTNVNIITEKSVNMPLSINNINRSNLNLHRNININNSNISNISYDKIDKIKKSVCFRNTENEGDSINNNINNNGSLIVNNLNDKYNDNNNNKDLVLPSINFKNFHKISINRINKISRNNNNTNNKNTNDKINYNRNLFKELNKNYRYMSKNNNNDNSKNYDYSFEKDKKSVNEEISRRIK